MKLDEKVRDVMSSAVGEWRGNELNLTSELIKVPSRLTSAESSDIISESYGA